MSKIAKTVQRMKQNPLGWQIDDLQTIANHYDIKWRHESGSHCIFLAPMKSLSVPAHRPIKPIYIKKFLALLEG